MRAARPPRSTLLRRFAALVGVVLLALAVRALVAVPRSVPSVSMLPALDVGDVFLAVRWPFGSPLAARFGGRGPRRGEIVVFRGPGGEGDVVKRVIALPGDRVALRGGIVTIDGRALGRFRVADAAVPAEPGRPCIVITASAPGGGALCRTPRWRETLADGTAWDVLGGGDASDLPASLRDMPERTVPRGHLFLLGDNRDRSADSRLAIADGGVGMVDARALLGRAVLILWSSDGSARLREPSSWWRAMRRERIGRALDAR